MNKKEFILFLSFILLSSFCFATGKKAFPAKKSVITIVCPNPPGGGTDAISRALASVIERDNGIKTVVKNIPDNSTATGTDKVLSLPADGYTLLVGGSHVIASTMQGLTKGYTELSTIAALNEDPYIIAVKKDSQFHTFRDIELYAKNNPGKIRLGNAGNGSATGAASIGLSLALNNEFTVLEYTGSAGLYPAIMKNYCDAGIFSQSEIVSHKYNLLPIAILTNGHSTLSDFSSVPTLRDEGYNIAVPGFSFRSIMVRKDTPASIKKQLANIIEKAFYSKSFQTFQKQSGLIQVFFKLDKADKFTDDLIKQYEPILRNAGLYKLSDSGSGASAASKEY